MTTPIGNSDDGAMFSSKPEEIETFSGHFVNLLKPDPDTIVMEDIAHHLAQITRYGGAAKRFYSVAEHCCLVMDLISFVPIEKPNLIQFVNSDFGLPQLQLAAILHDSSEAYLNDMTAPAKYAMRVICDDHIAGPPGEAVSAYDILEDRMTDVINGKFNVTQMTRPEVKIADLWAMKIEAKALIHSGGSTWRWTGDLPMDGVKPKGVVFRGGASEDIAEQLFLNRYRKICTDLEEQKAAIQEEA